MWFAASLLFKSQRDDSSAEDPLWEEQIVLFEAENESKAAEKANQYGASTEHEYRNQNGQLVRWSFKQVERICKVEAAFKDGTEIFSRFLRESEVKSLLTPFD
jgi:hypothetical protein